MSEQTDPRKKDNTAADYAKSSASTKRTFLAFATEAKRLVAKINKIDRFHPDEEIKKLPAESLKVAGEALARDVDQITETLMTIRFTDAPVLCLGDMKGIKA